jgi:hypothetical protein
MRKENVNTIQLQGANLNTSTTGTKARELPSWLKRQPSTHDIKSEATTSGSPHQEKGKKKPKLL